MIVLPYKDCKRRIVDFARRESRDVGPSGNNMYPNGHFEIALKRHAKSAPLRTRQDVSIFDDDSPAHAPENLESFPRKRESMSWIPYPIRQVRQAHCRQAQGRQVRDDKTSRPALRDFCPIHIGPRKLLKN